MAVSHVAIIMDGNRRWAKEKGLAATEGHVEGYETLKRIGRACLEKEIPFLTVYAFSTENWKRSPVEVKALLQLIHRALTADLEEYINQGVRLKIAGSRDGLPTQLQKAIKEAEEKTSSGTKGQFTLCFNYGGRAEILEAARGMIKEGFSPEEVTEERFTAHLWTGDLPEPELVIRTSGEQRMSGFLTWGSVYSELLFVDKYWPDFTSEDLDQALEEYESRERRRGK